ncbi:MAG: HEAT repeat domain-containing protein [Allomuricauda sp.]
MEQEKFEIRDMEYMAGTMSKEAARDFKKFLDENPEYHGQYQELVDMWAKVETMGAPEPSVKMDEAFFGMLSQELGKKERKTFWDAVVEGFSSIYRPQWAFGILLLGVGLALGYFLSPPNGTNSKEIVVSNDETADVRQKLVLTLLEQPSANQRLQGVSEANKFEDVDEIVIKALLQTLNSDSNVNVRLAAIESLTNYVDKPEVRQGLVQSIPNQESPILQITLANLMVALQEKTSIEPFKQLLKEKDLDTTVKKQIENSIKSII